MKASELKRGQVLDLDGRKILILQLDVQSPSSRSGSTLYKVRGHDIVTRQKFEARYKGDENIDTVDFGRRPVQFLYRDADGCTFMDRETFEQHTLADDMLEEELPYLDENLDGILAMVADGAILGIELPATVNLEITETALMQDLEQATALMRQLKERELVVDHPTRLAGLAERAPR